MSTEDTPTDAAVLMNLVLKMKGTAQTTMNAYRAMCAGNETVPRTKVSLLELIVVNYQVALTNSVSHKLELRLNFFYVCFNR